MDFVNNILPCFTEYLVENQLDKVYDTVYHQVKQGDKLDNLTKDLTKLGVKNLDKVLNLIRFFPMILLIRGKKIKYFNGQITNGFVEPTNKYIIDFKKEDCSNLIKWLEEDEEYF